MPVAEEIMAPLLFVIVAFVASSKFIALLVDAEIVPEFVTVKPSASFPLIKVLVPCKVAPDSITIVALSCSSIWIFWLAELAPAVTSLLIVKVWSAASKIYLFDVSSDSISLSLDTLTLAAFKFVKSKK